MEKAKIGVASKNPKNLQEELKEEGFAKVIYEWKKNTATRR